MMREKIPQIEKFNFCSECGHEKPGHFLECSSSEKPKDDKEYIVLLEKELSGLVHSLESGNYQGFVYDIEQRIEKLSKVLGGLLTKLEAGGNKDPWLEEMEERIKHYKHHGAGVDHWEAQRQERPIKKTTIEEEKPKTEERPKAPELSEVQEKIKKIFLEKLRENYNFATHGGKKALRQVLNETKDDGFWNNPTEKHRPSFLNALVTNIDEIYSNQALGAPKDKTIAIEYVFKNLEKEFDIIVGKNSKLDLGERNKELATIKAQIEYSRTEFSVRGLAKSLIIMYKNKTESELIRHFNSIIVGNVVEKDNSFSTFIQGIIKKRAFSYFAKNMKREFPQIEDKEKDKIVKALTMVISGIDLGV